MKHTDGHKHAFIKNGHVVNVAIFAEDAHDSSIIDDVKTMGTHDDVVCLCWWADQGNDTEPSVHWSWDGKEFAPPTHKWLFENGLVATDPDAPIETQPEVTA